MLTLLPYIKFFCFLIKKQDDTVYQKSSINLILPFFKDYIQSKCCSIPPLQDALSQYRWMNYLKIIRAATLTFILAAWLDWNTDRVKVAYFAKPRRVRNKIHESWQIFWQIRLNDHKMIFCPRNMSLPLHKFQLSLFTPPPPHPPRPRPIIQARNHEISKTGPGWRNSPQG